MDDLQPGQIEFKVHGIEHVNNSEVPVRVFAAKLRALIDALEAADTEANGLQTHQYTIARLHTSSPTAIINERPKAATVSLPEPAWPSFERGIDAIKASAKSIVDQPAFVRAVASMASGSAKNFSYAEVRTSADNVIRIDDFLRERATAAKRIIKKDGMPEGGWFRGVVIGSFDGALEYVDARGSLPQIKLTLSAGSNLIDCVCRAEDLDAIGGALGHRVRVFGRAIYDGATGLPRRVEVTKIEPVKTGDITRWKGAFESFAPLDWEGGNA